MAHQQHQQHSNNNNNNNNFHHQHHHQHSAHPHHLNYQSQHHDQHQQLQLTPNSNNLSRVQQFLASPSQKTPGRKSASPHFFHSSTSLFSSAHHQQQQQQQQQSHLGDETIAAAAAAAAASVNSSSNHFFSQPTHYFGAAASSSTHNDSFFKIPHTMAAVAAAAAAPFQPNTQHHYQHHQHQQAHLHQHASMAASAHVQASTLSSSSSTYSHETGLKSPLTPSRSKSLSPSFRKIVQPPRLRHKQQRMSNANAASSSTHTTPPTTTTKSTPSTHKATNEGVVSSSSSSSTSFHQEATVKSKPPALSITASSSSSSSSGADISSEKRAINPSEHYFIPIAKKSRTNDEHPTMSDSSTPSEKGHVNSSSGSGSGSGGESTLSSGKPLAPKPLHANAPLPTSQSQPQSQQQQQQLPTPPPPPPLLLLAPTPVKEEDACEAKKKEALPDCIISFKLPLNARRKTLLNFPPNQAPNSKKLYSIGMQKLRAANTLSTDRSIELLKRNIQFILNDELKSLLDSLSKDLIEPALNATSECSAQETSRFLVTLLEQAKENYFANLDADEGSKTTTDQVKQSTASNNRVKTRTALSSDTKFVLGKLVNELYKSQQQQDKSSGEANNELNDDSSSVATESNTGAYKSIYSENSSMFRYEADQFDRQWLSENSIIKRKNVKCILLLWDEASDLLLDSHNANNSSASNSQIESVPPPCSASSGAVNVAVSEKSELLLRDKLRPFTLPQFILSKINQEFALRNNTTTTTM